MFDGGIRLRRDGREVFHHLGVSAFATHAVVDRRSVVPIDEDVPAEVAALLGCAALTGGGAIMNAAVVQPGEAVIVVGLGGVGLAALQVALAHRDVDVIGVDILPAKRQTALRLGASAVAAPDRAVEEGLKAPVVVEAAGSAAAFDTALQLTEAGGRTVTVGLPDPGARSTISPLSLVAEGRSIIGSYLGSAVPERDIPKLADMWREGRLPLERLISSTIELGDLNEALDELADGRSIRQIIRFP
jgi:alcohol dehydrogenase